MPAIQNPESFWWYKEVPLQLDFCSSNAAPLCHNVPYPEDLLDEDLPRPSPSLSLETEEPSFGSTYRVSFQLNNLIAWRVIGDGRILEFRHLSLVTPPIGDGLELQGGPRSAAIFQYDEIESSKPVYFFLSSKIQPGVSFYEDYDSRTLNCFLLVETGLLYRFSFPFNNLFHANPLPRDYCKYYRLDIPANCEPILFHSVNAELAVVTFSNGSLTAIDLACGGQIEQNYGENEFEATPDSFRQYNLLENNFLSQVKSFLPIVPSRFLSKLGSSEYGASEVSRSSLSQPISLASFDYLSLNAFVFSLCRDRKIKVWSLSTQSCVKTISLYDSESSQPEIPLPPLPRPYIQVVKAEAEAETDGSVFNLVVYVPSESDPYFGVFRGHVDCSGNLIDLELVYKRACLLSQGRGQALETLVEFQIAPPRRSKDNLWSLWTLWDRQNQAVLKMTQIPLYFHADIEDSKDQSNYGQRWWSIISALKPEVDVNYFDSLLQSSSEDMKHVFLEYLFYPGRFSTPVLNEALSLYVSEQDDNKSFRLCRVGVRDEISSIIESPDHTDAADDTPEELLKKVKVKWLRFVSTCIELHNRANSPLGLSMLSLTHTVFVVKREGFSTLAGLSLVSSKLLASSYSQISVNDIRGDIVKLSKCLKFITQAIPSGNMTSLEEDLCSVLSNPLFLSVESFAQEFYDKHLAIFVSPALIKRIFNLLKSCNDLKGTISVLLDSLVDVKLESHNAEAEADAAQLIFKTSMLMDAIIAMGIQQVVGSRYAFSRNLFLLMTVVLVFDGHRKLMSNSVSVFSCSMSAMHSYSLMNWMSTQMVEKPRPVEVEEDSFSEEAENFVGKFATLNVSESAGAAGTLSYSLVHTLLHHHYPIHLNFASTQVSVLLNQAVSQFLHKIDLADSSLSISTQASQIKFAYRLVVFGYSSLVAQFLRFLIKSPAVMYLWGKVYLASGQFSEAQSSFESAAIGVDESTGIAQSDLAYVINANTCEDLPCFYHHVAGMFEEHNAYEFVMIFAKVALNTLSKQSKHAKELTKPLSVKLFKSALELGQYEEAYLAIMSNPEQDTKRDCLRHLLTVMCENNQTDRLCRFSFVGLQQEVEQTLLLKARHADILSTPNYYKILYVYHVFRGDYRNAAAAMYRYARRLATVDTPSLFMKISAERSKSYLAAINALHMVDEPYAWIVMKGPNDLADHDKRSRKRLHLGASDYATEASREDDYRVVKLEDIKQEYSLCLSKIQLIGRYPELESSGYSMESKDIVTLFVQAGMYDMAISTALTFKMELTHIFESLTLKCIQLVDYDRLDRPIDDNDMILVNDGMATWDGSLLSKYLMQHDSQATCFKYHKCMLLPPWLAQTYLTYNCEDYIRICMKYDLIEEAAQCALKQIRKELSVVHPVTVQMTSRYLPYTLENSIGARLAEERPISSSSVDRLQRLLEELQQQLKIYFRKVDEETDECSHQAPN
ncbi:hypothetical protein K493DRAFT_318887 [Basidiobolus meristosporus CBS 931.73]|uniref:Nucleoporin Nup120/160-domain-containing protein n=1 Tax=Basidiobolus meristosporus CBS 931.73 TaxID=1314790 RepID=A0A1Y1XV82_9FUNG|nr:hypothetical protein K493DRAFT_318887 [Basidiobolus meristosporus CBS 931.73]|eukprot:ORX89184.1 hypothetical protein K493DRAFT_318887 [Basidiobolus meristosporus CBS 931.73]